MGERCCDNNCCNNSGCDWIIWIILIVVIFCFCGNGNGLFGGGRGCC
ncbi:MAG: hypothetical protein LBI03_00865 [Clostridiales bacterium]|nr:hypothetical protein [Clostridiales bacterium]